MKNTTKNENIQINNTASKRCLIRTVPLRHGWVGGRRKWYGLLALMLSQKVKSTGTASRSKSCRFERPAAPAAYGVRSNAR